MLLPRRRHSASAPGASLPPAPVAVRPPSSSECSYTAAPALPVAAGPAAGDWISTPGQDEMGGYVPLDLGQPEEREVWISLMRDTRSAACSSSRGLHALRWRRYSSVPLRPGGIDLEVAGAKAAAGE